MTKLSVAWAVGISALAALSCGAECYDFQARIGMRASRSESPQTPPHMFDDVKLDCWVYNEMSSLANTGIVYGYPDKYFNRKRILTRYEFAYALAHGMARIEFTPSRTSIQPLQLREVTPERYASLKKLIIEFRDELIALSWESSRVEKAVHRIAQAAGLRDQPFHDVPTNHWAYQAVESLRKKGVLLGYPDDSLRGKRTMTRSEAAVALDRSLGMSRPPYGIRVKTGPPGEPGLQIQHGVEF